MGEGTDTQTHSRETALRKAEEVTEELDRFRFTPSDNSSHTKSYPQSSTT